MNESQVPGSRGEMVAALRVHVRLLTRYAQEAFGNGNSEFIGEVAAKLRLLVTRSRSNEPLLLRLIEESAEQITFTLGGPPNRPNQQGYQAGDAVPLDAYMAFLAIGVRVHSGVWVELTNANLIRALAEQVGASHEDWTLDESLHTILNMGVHIGGLPGASAALQAITNVVLHVANRFLTKVDAGEISL